MTAKMVRTKKKLFLISALLTAVAADYACADVQDFTDSERPLWFDAVGDLGGYDTIDFTGFTDGTIITTQYQTEFGGTFTDGNDNIFFCPSCFPIDDYGLEGLLTTTIVFDTPQNWFAVDTPGAMQLTLYQGESLVYTSRVSFFGFSGVISDIGFDKVILDDPEDSTVAMDNIYFGAVPAPGAMMIIGGSLIFKPKKRRREE